MTRTYDKNAIAQLIADDLKRQGIKATRIYGKAEYDVEQSVTDKFAAAFGVFGNTDFKPAGKPTVKTKSITFYAEVPE